MGRREDAVNAFMEGLGIAQTRPTDHDECEAREERLKAKARTLIDRAWNRALDEAHRVAVEGGASTAVLRGIVELRRRERG